MTMDLKSVNSTNPTAATGTVKPATTAAETSAPVSKIENSGVVTEKNDKNEHTLGEPSEDAIKDVVSQVNSKVKNGTKCEFSYHEGTHRICITIKDKETDEVVREIPPKESLDMLQRLWEMAGLIVDEKR